MSINIRTGERENQTAVPNQTTNNPQSKLNSKGSDKTGFGGEIQKHSSTQQPKEHSPPRPFPNPSMEHHTSNSLGDYQNRSETPAAGGPGEETTSMPNYFSDEPTGTNLSHFKGKRLSDLNIPRARGEPSNDSKKEAKKESEKGSNMGSEKDSEKENEGNSDEKSNKKLNKKFNVLPTKKTSLILIDKHVNRTQIRLHGNDADFDVSNKKNPKILSSTISPTPGLGNAKHLYKHNCYFITFKSENFLKNANSMQTLSNLIPFLVTFTF